MSNTDGVGTIKLEEFGAILERAFVTYGLSVVTDRALPDARDGLKPVQRRILYCMWVNRYNSSRPTVKSAEVVGKVLGDYHPHSDSAVYDAAVRMAQEFTLRYPLIEGQGNFGSIDDDPAAAYRYTEMRLSTVGELMLQDIDKQTVPLKPSYKQDPKVVEPEYLPARIPPVCNPSSGIAVGLATNIPPHNLGEVLAACLALFDNPRMTVSDLMQIIRGPDFPGGGQIVGVDGIRDYLTTGKGRVVVRGTVKLEETGRQRSLVISQLPPISKARLKAGMVKAFNDRRLDGLVPDVRDESDTEKGVRIVLDVKRDGDPVQMLNALYRYTDLQLAVSVQMVFLFGQSWEPARQPRQAGMLELLTHYNEHQLDVLRRRAAFDLAGAQSRLHVVEGLIIGSANATEIVRIFQAAADRADAKSAIRARYSLDEIQAETIAAMTLAQVTRLDASRFVAERATLAQQITELEDLLSDPGKQVAAIRADMQVIARTHGDDRRTLVDPTGDPTIEVTEVVPGFESRPITLVVGGDGAIKVVPRGTFKRPATREYPTIGLATADAVDSLLVVVNTGRIFGVRVQDLPEGTRASRGEPIRKFARLDPNEAVVAALPVSGFDAVVDEQEGGHTLVVVTALGRVKRSALSDLRGVGSGGVSELRLAPGDVVVGAMIVRPSHDLLLMTSDAKGLRFSGTELRSTGRGTQGVAGISIAEHAQVIGVGSCPASGTAPVSLFTIDARGNGKRSLLADIPTKGRATGGVRLAPVGVSLAGASVQSHDSIIMVRTNAGLVTRLSPRDIPLLARTERGSVLVTLSDGDLISGIIAMDPTA